VNRSFAPVALLPGFFVAMKNPRAPVTAPGG
jgi:hypothetical protein